MQRTDICLYHKSTSQIPVSLLLWHKIIANYFYIRSLALWLQTNTQVLESPPVNILTLYLMLNGGVKVILITYDMSEMGFKCSLPYKQKLTGKQLVVARQLGSLSWVGCDRLHILQSHFNTYCPLSWFVAQPPGLYYLLFSVSVSSCQHCQSTIQCSRSQESL